MSPCLRASVWGSFVRQQEVGSESLITWDDYERVPDEDEIERKYVPVRGTSAEHKRLNEDRRRWLEWGPYLAERAWGTVREDYSKDGEVWSHFVHDEAKSRTYRWNEDGLAGICDTSQHLCLAFAFWNNEDECLKERLFGLNGDEGNHGEDAKECWWYLDATPTASYLKWAYVYPQREFPYRRIREENARRTRKDPEFEIEDTAIFESGYWDIQVEYAKNSPDDICILLKARNCGQATEELHILPTLWHRNTWSFRQQGIAPKITTADGCLRAKDDKGKTLVLSSDQPATSLFCENETNAVRIWDSEPTTPWPKDGINDHIVHGHDTVNPDQHGSKAALWHRLSAAPGETIEIRLRFRLENEVSGQSIDEVLEARRKDADDFYDQVIPKSTNDEDRRIARESLAGMVWSKQFYAFDVESWLEGDPGMPTPPPERKEIRNRDWGHHHAADIIAMPDPWEYPWYAAWDLAFHCIPLAHIDSQFAKEQLTLLCRGAFMHPNGQLPAYEWAFDDVNPPVHAMAALEVYHIDGSRDRAFLATIFNKLLLNFTWWVNRKDSSGRNVFQGGFLGLDNIGPIDRSCGLPEGFHLEQSDGTAWMASFALKMLEIALELSEEDPVYEDMAIKFFDHFAYIATAIHEHGLWDEESGFYYDVLHGEDQTIPLQVRSMVGLLPLFAAGRLSVDRILTPSRFADHVLWFVSHRKKFAENIMGVRTEISGKEILLAIADLARTERVLKVMLDPKEFLSPFGVRSMSAAHREHPFRLQVAGIEAEVGYEPGESESGLFGGNSNWRGPVWFPVNHLLVQALQEYGNYAGESFLVEYPTGSGKKVSLLEVADDVSDRLIGLFRADPAGVRPFTGRPYEDWYGRLLFHEYFDGDTGRGLGASHQTGWTGLVADLIIRRKQPSSDS